MLCSASDETICKCMSGFAIKLRDPVSQKLLYTAWVGSSYLKSDEKYDIGFNIGLKKLRYGSLESLIYNN